MPAVETVSAPSGTARTDHEPTGVTLLVRQGDLVFGRWQGVFFCELDGPRQRTLHVQYLGAFAGRGE